MTGGSDGQAGGGGWDLGGRGGGSDGGADLSGDGALAVEVGGGCTSGWPETGEFLKSGCAANQAPMGGAILDGRYELVSFTLLGSCTFDELPLPISRSLTVTGNIWTGVDGLTDATGSSKIWTHWRAMVGTNGTQIFGSYQCGTSEVGNTYSVVPDGLILYAKRGPSAWVFRFKRV
jgi:hypothetical protein